MFTYIKSISTVDFSDSPPTESLDLMEYTSLDMITKHFWPFRF